MKRLANKNKITFLLTRCLLISIMTYSNLVYGQFDHFITVAGNKLMDGEQELRFISFNVPTLNYVEDNMSFEQTNPYGLPSEFELRDLFETVQMLGGQVVRTYTIPVRNKNFPKECITYVEGPGQFNEEAFQALDMVLALAAEYKIRVIIPLVNNWQWMGGRPDYAAFRDKKANEFWTDPQLIDDFKRTISYVLNRTNTITGQKYKDDKTILAWETGNELENPPQWGIDIARYVKSIDQNHLLMDGYYAIHGGGGYHVFIQEYAINEPAIDIISTHHYEPNAQDMITNLKTTVDMVEGKKPIMVDEFGFIGTTGMEQVIDYIVEEDALVGGLVWSLRRHHPEGGFYHHSEPFGNGVYRAYHYPGFSDGELYDEKNLMELIRQKAFAIQKLAVSAIQPPKAPTLLPFTDTPKFTWQGAAGASGYNIERKAEQEDEWKTIAYNVDDVDTPGFDLYSDETAQVGEKYSYRIRAINQAGVSEPSNVVGPIEIAYLTRVDYTRHLMTLFSSEGLSVQTGDYRSFKEAFSRLHGGKEAQGVYAVPGEFKAIKVYAYEATEKPSLSFSVSHDGAAFQAVVAQVEEYKSTEENYDYLIPRLYAITMDQLEGTVPLNFRNYFRFKVQEQVDIVRVEIEYE